MLRTRRLTSRIVVLTICSMMVLSVPLVTADEESVTLMGEIEVAERDDEGNVNSVAVYDVEWGWVLVANKGKGKELLDHVGSQAAITGRIVEIDDDIDYTYEITVTDYKIEDTSDPDLEPEWEPEG